MSQVLQGHGSTMMEERGTHGPMYGGTGTTDGVLATAMIKSSGQCRVDVEQVPILMLLSDTGQYSIWGTWAICISPVCEMPACIAVETPLLNSQKIPQHRTGTA